MKVVLTGGGTAGHITPALSVADYIKKKEKGSEFIYIGNKDKMESSIVPKAGYKFIGLLTTGLSRKLSPKGILQNIKALWQNKKVGVQVRKILKDFEPDFVFATAGYVSAPTIAEAIKLKIPVFIHESNGYPGMVTKLYAKKATCVFLGDEGIKKHLNEKAKTKVVGTPISKSIVEGDRKKSREALSIKDEDFVILSFGGSLGARTINQLMAYLMGKKKDEKNLIFIHAMGSLYLEYFPQYLKENGVDDYKTQENLRILEYIDNMDLCLYAADLVISRSGINTVNEIGVAGVASVLIPSPNVTENHQYHNAMILGSKGAAVVIEEKDVTKEKLLTIVSGLIDNKKKTKTMGLIGKNTIKTNATKEIYRGIKEMLF